MRGEHHVARASAPAVVGLIPACAGNTYALWTHALCKGAHPRMRGEHSNTKLVSLPMFGSSPHARGTLRSSSVALTRSRLIPACAGNTRGVCNQQHRRGAHPRMRGEHYRHTLRLFRVEGSSPHARGTPEGRVLPRAGGRLIPACAGNTSTTNWSQQSETAHPRMRGEHDRAYLDFGETEGSSPHARGTPPRGTRATSRQRLIPACAGNTISNMGRPFVSWAHPRMRGEHCGSLGLGGRLTGSSPHARGTLFEYRTVVLAWGLIPACAGNTRAHNKMLIASGAHPRMRGEHTC